MAIGADQKHVPQLSKDLGLTQSNIVKSPGMRMSASEAGPMRCAYLAQHFVDISEAITCLARAMSKSRAGHMTQLKKLRGI